MNTYELIDSGNFQKLERFGDYLIARPASQAIWKPQHPKMWKKAHAVFQRDPENSWTKPLNATWTIDVADITFQLTPTDFGHLGIFPEQAPFWEWIQKVTKPKSRVLNLFAYSGGSTLAAAKAGASVCHLDASKGMVQWAKENAALNKLENIRWIVDDVTKFLKREVRRENKYDAIILDPPTFGRGPKGEVFKIEEKLLELLDLCCELLSENPHYLLLSCHTPGITPIALHNILSQLPSKGKIETGEMLLTGKSFSLPSGTYGRYVHQ